MKALFKISLAIIVLLAAAASGVWAQKRAVETAEAPKAIGPYSQAIVANGFVFVAGQIGTDPKTGTLAEGIEAQAEQTLKNIDRPVHAYSVSLDFPSALRTVHSGAGPQELWEIEKPSIGPARHGAHLSRSRAPCAAALHSCTGACRHSQVREKQTGHQEGCSAQETDEEARIFVGLDVMWSARGNGARDTGAEDERRVLLILDDVEHAPLDHDDLPPHACLRRVTLA